MIFPRRASGACRPNSSDIRRGRSSGYRGGPSDLEGGRRVRLESSIIEPREAWRPNPRRKREAQPETAIIPQKQEFESRRELKVFLHSVTHDLKTPVMASSIVLSNILQQPGEEITLNRSVLERLHQGSDRIFKIVDTLIEAHSTEVNGIKLIPQFCRLQDLVNSVLIDLQPTLLQHQALVQNCLSEHLPDIWADPIQLWRVLNNLIGNALKHNPNSVRITIDATVEKDHLYLTVSDDGIGIFTEQSDRLFKLYARGKRSRYMPGLGIGLYLSQQIITAHGGEIGVVSTLGNGCTVWLTLPIVSS